MILITWLRSEWFRTSHLRTGDIPSALVPLQMSFQPIFGRERSFAATFVTRERLIPWVSLKMSFQVMRREKRLLTIAFGALKRTLLRVDTYVFCKIALCCKTFVTVLKVTIEKISFVESLVRTETVQRVEGFLTTVGITGVWFLACMVAVVNFETVRRHKTWNVCTNEERI